MAELLSVKSVSKVFGSERLFQKDVTVAVDDVTFSITEDRPTITAIAGESGSGKTTLSLLMMGQLTPTSGEIFYRGKNIVSMTREEKFNLRREVQPIYQDPYAAFNPFYRVDHVLEMAIRNFKLAKSKQETELRIEEALKLVGLRSAETLGRYPHQLSGGQRQRLMVARAMLCRPGLIMADEPVSMVDASLRATILSSLRKLNQDFGISIVYITHDLTTAYQISQNIIIMYAGAVVEAGSVDRVIRFPKHPYTQLLISSIPQPSKEKLWGGGETEEAQTSTRKSSGCRFAARCPVAMQICWTQKPPLFRLDEDRAATCFQYQGNEIIEHSNLAAVMK